MDLLNRDKLRELMQKQEGWCVSIYMGTHRAFPDTKQDPIRFKNLLRQAEDHLKKNGLRATEAKKFLKPASGLIRDGLFWKYQADGFAVFLSSKGSWHYHFPLTFDEKVVVTDRFHLKPLFPLFFDDGRFFILALSQKDVRFFHGTRYSLSQLEVAGLPRSMEEALKYDEPEKQLQFHTRTPGTAGERAAMFHGHGVGTDDAKTNILRFFHHVDSGLQNILGGEQVPLVLAGVDYLLPIYREANRYPHVLDSGITGNPQGLSGDELHEQAWKIAETHFRKAREEAMALYRQFAGSGRASGDLKEILGAAYDGRIDTLMVAIGTEQWGVFDPETRTVDLHSQAEPGDEDLLDYAAVHTFLNRGKVYALKPEEIPNGGVAAALFRYP